MVFYIKWFSVFTKISFVTFLYYLIQKLYLKTGNQVVTQILSVSRIL